MRPLTPDQRSPGPVRTPGESRFRALYDDAYADVLRFAQRRVDHAQAEDVVAEAFLVVWRRIDQAPARHDDLRAWLFGITRNCLLNAHRAEGRRDALAVRVADGVPPAPAGLEADLVIQRVDLAAAWRGLGPTDQEALALTVFEDLTSPQAARVLGITAASYRIRLLRARRALRRRLDAAGPTAAPPVTPAPAVTAQMETTP